MKAKKQNICILLIIFILVVGIITLSRNILNVKSKEVKVAKEFIEVLIDKKIIDENKEELLGEEYLNKAMSKNSNIKYSVILGSYAVDIDKDFNVIGFSNKNLYIKDKTINIKKEEAISLAKEYIKRITDSEVLFKEVKEKDGESNSHYSVVFNKARNGYPIYRKEITMVIDKYNGKLDCYTNNNLNINNYNDNVKFTENEIKDIMNNYFKEINKNIIKISNGEMAYVESNGEYVLSYIFKVKSEATKAFSAKLEEFEKSYDDKDEEILNNEEVTNEEILIIRTDSGEFINLDTSIINK